MKSIVAYYPNPDQPEFIDTLQTLLPPEITIVMGDVPPDTLHAYIGWTFDREMLSQHPEFRWMIQPYTGIDPKITEIATSLPNVSLHNTHTNAQATAEFAVSLLFSVAKCVVPTDRALRRGDWQSYWNPFPQPPAQSLQLGGKRVLVLGFGAIGQRVGAMLCGMGMRVRGMKRSAEPNQKINGIPVHPIDELHNLLPRTDVLMVCLPLTAETEGIIDKEELDLMPRRGLVINVGRGPLIDEQALYEALCDRTIHGAGIDVWYNYPKSHMDGRVVCPSNYPMYQLDNLVMTPHRAGMLMDGESDDSIPLAVADLLIAAANGEPVPNQVNLDAGY